MAESKRGVFHLDDTFVKDLSARKSPFKDGLGEAVFYRTFSRRLENGTKESWWQVVKRVVEGTYNMQLKQRFSLGLSWDEKAKQIEAQTMANYIFTMKFLPPGRGLWAMGTGITDDKELFAALNNCAFVSTVDLVKAAQFLMDNSMLGVGVGFDTLGAWDNYVYSPAGLARTIVIEDSREGWHESTAALLESYLSEGEDAVIFDYSKLRPKGAPLKTFGGVSSGPEPLKLLHETLRGLLQAQVGKQVSTRLIVDIMNAIGVCVISGNVRRSAELALGSYGDADFMSLKDWDNKENSYRSSWGWASNNSVSVPVGAKYDKLAASAGATGEPGFVWMDNIRAFGRMGRNISSDKCMQDPRAAGVNPCSEMSLEPYELCCLVETFPTKCKDRAEFLDVLKYAHIYAKTVTLGRTHWPETNEVLLRNRRMGVSVTGVSTFVEDKGVHEFKEWLTAGYDWLCRCDKEFSEYLKIVESIKLTTVKPSGTVSLIAGVPAGISYPESRYCIRRVTFADNDPILDVLKTAGYYMEPSTTPSSTCVEFIMDNGDQTTRLELSVWEQLELAAFMQEWWSDNQVSTTVYVKPEEKARLAKALEYKQYALKAISFMPAIDYTSKYKQCPYEPITKENYLKRAGNIKPLDFGALHGKVVADAAGEAYCTNATCDIRL